MQTRSDLEALAVELLSATRPFATDAHGRIELPGPTSSSGAQSDGLEAFARTFILAALLLRGSDGQRHRDIGKWYAAGIEAGVTGGGPDRWPTFAENPQSKVEAASIALGLDMTREWIWDEMSDDARGAVIDYLSAAVGDDTYPQINWVWFRLVVQTFLRSVDGPHSLDEMRADLATHDTFLRGGGWMADGTERSFDHYGGWALHLYPTLWSRMAGATDLAAERGTRDRDRLDLYIGDALALVGADGAPLMQGRSLTYRFAAAAQFWCAAIAKVPSHSGAELGAAARAIINYFTRSGVPDERGLLSVGWFGQWPQIAQTYTGSGSPYWGAKAFLGLLLADDHAAWTGAAELPVARGDFVRAIVAPGWIAAGTQDDGIVRVVNHGTDHARAGDAVGDSPLYARLGYSTATMPPMDDASWELSRDQSVCVVDATGRTTHRAGFETLAVRADGDRPVAVGVAASRGPLNWIAAEPGQRHHGSGLRGTATPAATATVVSIVRGAHEVRLVRLDNVADHGATALRISGWPLSADAAPATLTSPAGAAAVATPDLVSRIVAVAAPDAQASSMALAEGSPLGAHTAVPYIDVPITAGRWTGAVVELSGTRNPQSPTAWHDLPTLPSADVRGDDVIVTWPEGDVTTTHLKEPFPTAGILQ